jgi:hypothetical protein
LPSWCLLSMIGQEWMRLLLHDWLDNVLIALVPVWRWDGWCCGLDHFVLVPVWYWNVRCSFVNPDLHSWHVLSLFLDRILRQRFAAPYDGHLHALFRNRQRSFSPLLRSLLNHRCWYMCVHAAGLLCWYLPWISIDGHRCRWRLWWRLPWC